MQTIGKIVELRYLIHHTKTGLGDFLWDENPLPLDKAEGEHL